jgi:radical SAM superfamily enzyme YgiQ (UPF0313 family)
MKVKMILPALTEAESPFWRPIKYSLFPPLGLATLAAYLSPEDEIELQDQHVETVTLNDTPDLVVIQVYITNAYRAYAFADHYRAIGSYVILGGLHVTSLPDEAQQHADSIFLGPGEETFPEFLMDLKNGRPKPRYFSSVRTLDKVPPIRRDLIKRNLYLVPNSIVVTRGCPHHCTFCYKDAFFEGGKSFYTQPVDDALAEIERLPGRHLYFLDDHLLGNVRFAESLFEGMKGMNRVFQSAATVDSILRGNLIEKAAAAGLRSLFVGFETFSTENLKQSNKKQNLKKDYQNAVARLHSLGIMINGSFVFGLDDDDQDVFKRTVDWGVKIQSLHRPTIFSRLIREHSFMQTCNARAGYLPVTGIYTIHDTWYIKRKKFPAMHWRKDTGGHTGNFIPGAIFFAEASAMIQQNISSNIFFTQAVGKNSKPCGISLSKQKILTTCFLSSSPFFPK